MKQNRLRSTTLLILLSLVVLSSLSACENLRARAEGGSGGLHSWGIGIRF